MGIAPGYATAGCTPAAAQTQFDLRNPGSCLDMLNGIMAAYLAAIGGTQRVTVRFQERWSEYGKADAEKLRTTYVMLYRQCPLAVTEGLPDLSNASQVRRGPPARGFQTFPRL